MKITFTQLTEMELVSQENCKLIKKNAISFPEPAVKSKKGRIPLAVEKRFHFLVFYFYFPNLSRAQSKALWRKNPSYFQKTRG